MKHIFSAVVAVNLLSHVRANQIQHLTPTLKIRMTEPARCVVVPTAVESVNIQATEGGMEITQENIQVKKYLEYNLSERKVTGLLFHPVFMK